MTETFPVTIDDSALQSCFLSQGSEKPCISRANSEARPKGVFRRGMLNISLKEILYIIIDVVM